MTPEQIIDLLKSVFVPVILSLISAAGAALGTVVMFRLKRTQTLADIDVRIADAAKVLAEAEKVKAEAEKVRADAAKVLADTDTVEITNQDSLMIMVKRALFELEEMQTRWLSTKDDFNAATQREVSQRDVIRQMQHQLDAQANQIAAQANQIAAQASQIAVLTEGLRRCEELRDGLIQAAVQVQEHDREKGAA